MNNYTDEEILKISLSDILDDFYEQKFLLNSFLGKIETNFKTINKQSNNIDKSSYILAQRQLSSLIILINEKIKITNELLSKTKSINPKIELITYLENKKEEIYQFLRFIPSQIASLITFSDFQSPSFDFSLFSEAGRQSGKIDATINDYKRDQHQDARQMENLFLKEMIDQKLKSFVRVYSTSSGMSAFATILSYVYFEKNIRTGAIAGEGTYFEAKKILDKAYAKNIKYIKENETERIIQLVKDPSYKVLFLDTVTNREEILMPDPEKIIKEGILKRKSPFIFVLDNTSIGPFFQLIKDVSIPALFTNNITLISYESLNKFYQYGLDRTTGGIITSVGRDAGKMYDYRDHLGTNIPDINSLSIPDFNRIILEKRLQRINRNNLFLSESINSYLNKYPSKLISGISYPLLKIHDSYNIAKKIGFGGPFFSIIFHKRNIPQYKKFLYKILMSAKKRGVQITAGTSFGLNHTRVYVTSYNPKRSIPFFRISSGTENLRQIMLIKNSLIEAVKKM